MTDTRLAEHFHHSVNGLNFLRLLLAAHVIVWHTYAVQGRDFGDSPYRQLMSSFGVDGFFAVSGFLILASWQNTPRVREFLVARFLRILPAFYVVLLVTVLVIAPIGVALQGGGPVSVLTDPQSYRYVWNNVTLWIFEPGVAGTPQNVAYPGSWNASLWTLAWEFACYMGVLALGVARLAGRRWVIAALFLASTAASAGVMALEVGNPTVQAAVRFALMFSAGMALYTFRDRIRVNAPIVAAAVVVAAASVLVDDYRVIAALPMTYLLFVGGGALRHPRFRFKTDVSYGVYIYAFPVQQVLVMAGLASLPVPAFAILALACTLPLAWLSWTFVEKPALDLKKRLRGRRGSRQLVVSS